MQDRFPSHDVIALTGITARQLQWWDERKVVCPHHEGHTRFYSPENTVCAAVVAELRRKQLSLQKIRRILPAMRRRLSQGEWLEQAGLVNLYLVTDGRSMFCETNLIEIVGAFRDAKRPMYLVSIGDQIEKMKKLKAVAW